MTVAVGTVGTLSAGANASVQPGSGKIWLITTLAFENADEDGKFRLDTGTNCEFAQGAHLSQYSSGQVKLVLTPTLYMEVDNTDGSNAREYGYSGLEIQ